MGEYIGERNAIKRARSQTPEEHIAAAEHHVSVLEESSNNSWGARADLANMHAAIALAQATLRMTRGKR